MVLKNGLHICPSINDLASTLIEHPPSIACWPIFCCSAQSALRFARVVLFMSLSSANSKLLLLS